MDRMAERLPCRSAVEAVFTSAPLLRLLFCRVTGFSVETMTERARIRRYRCDVAAARQGARFDHLPGGVRSMAGPAALCCHHPLLARTRLRWRNCDAGHCWLWGWG